jgi:hypothetical protein
MIALNRKATASDAPRRRCVESGHEGQGAGVGKNPIEVILIFDMALAGDPVALRICLERICPVRKDRAVRFPLPPITSARDAADIAAAVAQAVAAGHITPSEAAEIGKVIDTYMRAYQTAELNDRVACVKQMTDEELMCIIRNGSGESTPPRLLTIDSG